MENRALAESGLYHSLELSAATLEDKNYSPFPTWPAGVLLSPSWRLCEHSCGEQTHSCRATPGLVTHIILDPKKNRTIVSKKSTRPQERKKMPKLGHFCCVPARNAFVESTCILEHESISTPVTTDTHKYYQGTCNRNAHAFRR